MQRGDPCVPESRDVLSAGALMMHSVTAVPGIGIGKRTAGEHQRGCGSENGFQHGHLQWSLSILPSRGTPTCLIKLKFRQRLRARNLHESMFSKVERRKSDDETLRDAVTARDKPAGFRAWPRLP